MTTVSTRVPQARRERGWARGGLLLVLVVVAANAVYGGIGLVVDGMGMPDEWLGSLPVDTWTWPGIALLVTVALPQLVAGWLVWRRHPRAAAAGLVAGAGLVVWIAVQLALLQRYFFLQPVIAGLGVVEMLFAWAWWSSLRQVSGPASR